MGFGNVGRVWTPKTLEEHLQGLTPHARWKAVCLHHCYRPDLTLRPSGFKIEHIVNMRSFYRDQLGWSSGPHFYTDEDQVFGMCPPNEIGTHARSFNGYALGIEALGDYGSGIAGETSDDPKSGRGLAVWKTTAQTAAVLLRWLKLPADPTTVLFHRDDPKTDKECPGTRVGKEWVLGLIAPYMAQGVSAPEPPSWSLTGGDGSAFTPVVEHGNRPCVPVYALLRAEGVPSAEILAALRARGGRFFYGDTELLGAFVDAQGSTWAPVREVTNALGWTLARTGHRLEIRR